ncbi:MAG: YabP/YqfC family sporulation protein [Clostridia bacterium]|nr:YabP/YqfC family sporulation protein [Clostridia bacterium]
MAYLEDIKRIFGSEKTGECEVLLSGTSALVISGHRGLSSLSEGEIVVRRKRGSLRVAGRALRLLQASPAELYIAGEIRAVEYVDPSGEVGS